MSYVCSPYGDDPERCDLCHHIVKRKVSVCLMYVPLTGMTPETCQIACVLCMFPAHGDEPLSIRDGRTIIGNDVVRHLPHRPSRNVGT